MQIALKKKTDDKTVVDGILYCADGQTSTLVEYQRYIGFNHETDDQYVWVVHEFMNEKLPQNIYQYSSNGMVYWVDAKTQESTWKHPIYEK